MLYHKEIFLFYINVQQHLFNLWKYILAFAIFINAISLSHDSSKFANLTPWLCMVDWGT